MAFKLAVLAAALLASGIGTIAWWRYRREVVSLLRRILEELQRRPPE